MLQIKSSANSKAKGSFEIKDLAHNIANSSAKDIKEYTNGVLDIWTRIHDVKWTDLVGEDEHKNK